MGKKIPVVPLGGPSGIPRATISTNNAQLKPLPVDKSGISRQRFGTEDSSYLGQSTLRGDPPIENIKKPHALTYPDTMWYAKQSDSSVLENNHKRKNILIR